MQFPTCEKLLFLLQLVRNQSARVYFGCIYMKIFYIYNSYPKYTPLKIKLVILVINGLWFFIIVMHAYGYKLQIKDKRR